MSSESEHVRPWSQPERFELGMAAESPARIRGHRRVELREVPDAPRTPRNEAYTRTRTSGTGAWEGEGEDLWDGRGEDRAFEAIEDYWHDCRPELASGRTPVGAVDTDPTKSGRKRGRVGADRREARPRLQCSDLCRPRFSKSGRPSSPGKVKAPQNSRVSSIDSSNSKR